MATPERRTVSSTSLEGTLNVSPESITVITEFEYPEVIILLPAPVSGQREYVVEFKWTKPIQGFQLTDIDATNCVLSDLSGSGQTWSAKMTLAANTASQASITVDSNTVADEDGLLGPRNKTTVLLNFDTRQVAIPGGQCVATFDYTDSSFPYVSGTDQGGSFESVMECVGHGNFLYEVIQIGRYTKKLDTSTERTGDTGFVAEAITGEIQASAVLIRTNLTNCTRQLLRYYDDVSTAACGLKVVGNRIYFFEGCYYAYYNEGLLRQIGNPQEARTIELTERRQGALDDSGERITGTFSGGVVGHQVHVPTAWRVDKEGQISIRIDTNNADFQTIRRGFKRGSIVAFGSIPSMRRLLIESVELNITQRNGVFTITYIALDDFDFPAVGTKTELHLGITNTEEVYSVNRLRDLQEQDNWKAEIGHLYSISAGTGTISDLGLNWKSSDVEDNPHADEPVPHYLGLENQPVDRFYGVHGGMISPIVHDGTKLHFITGYGNINEIDDNESEASRLENWQWITYHENLNRKVVKLETNGRTALELLEEVCKITDSIMYPMGDKFIIKERLSDPVVADHTLSVKQDTLIKPILNITAQNDLDHVFNNITIIHGQNKEYKHPPDKDSVKAYGNRELVVHTILDETQREWIVWLAEKLLAQFKDMRRIITLRTEALLYGELGDIFEIEGSDRDAINTKAQLVDIDMRFTRPNRNSSLTMENVMTFVSLGGE